VSAALNQLQNDLTLSGASAKQVARALHRTAGKTIVSVSVLSRGMVCAALRRQCLVLDTAQTTTAFLVKYESGLCFGSG